MTETDKLAATLHSLRWKEDQVVVNPLGERVWLRKCDDGRGITDCCLEEEPCPYHVGLSCPAPIYPQ